MYAKVFDSLWTGSMRGKSDLQLVFIFMLSNADARGILDVTPEVIADSTGLPLDRVLFSLLALEQPDPRSRTRDYEGARILRIDDHRDWGWLIVNHEKYASLNDLDRDRQLTRERVRKHRNAMKRSVTLGNDIQTHTQIQTQKDKDSASDEAASGFDQFYKAYPRKVKKPRALKAWKAQKILTQEELDRVMAGLNRWRENEWAGKDRQYIPHPASWLNDRQWEDDVAAQAPIVAPGASNAATEARREWAQKLAKAAGRGPS